MKNKSRREGASCIYPGLSIRMHENRSERSHTILKREWMQFTFIVQEKDLISRGVKKRRTREDEEADKRVTTHASKKGKDA